MYILFNRLISYLEHNNILYNYQFRFRKNHFSSTYWCCG